MPVRKGGGHSGYGIRSGRWKGVVPHCAAANGHPSPLDVMEVYALDADPFEQHNLNGTAAGAEQKQRFLAIAAAHNLTCACFQC